MKHIFLAVCISINCKHGLGGSRGRCDYVSRDGSYGRTVTASASMWSPLSVIKLLVDRGGLIVGTDSVALAVFANVSGALDRFEVVEYLPDNGAHVDTHLYVNCLSRMVSMISMYGIETSLLLVVKGGKKDMVELFLNREVDRNLTRRGLPEQGSFYCEGKSALEMAEMNGFEDVARMLKEEDEGWVIVSLVSVGYIIFASQV